MPESFLGVVSLALGVLAGLVVGALATLHRDAAPLRERLYRWSEDRPKFVRAPIGLVLVFLGYEGHDDALAVPTSALRPGSHGSIVADHPVVPGMQHLDGCAATDYGGDYFLVESATPTAQRTIIAALEQWRARP